MQFADVRFVLMQIWCDGWQSSEAMNWCCTKPCSAQVLAAKRSTNIVANTEQFCANTTQPRDFLHQATKILYADLFSVLVFLALPFNRRNHFHPLHLWFLPRRLLTHRDAFTHECFYTEMLFAKYTCFDTNLVLLQTNAFMHRCFYTGMLLTRRSFYTDAQVFLHTDAFAQWCFYTAECFYTTSTCAFTRGFFWHKVAFTHRSFYTNALYAEMVPTRNAFIQRRLLHTDICTKEVFFCTVFFAERCFSHRGAFRLGHF